jgi:hypothetical protein
VNTPLENVKRPATHYRVPSFEEEVTYIKHNKNMKTKLRPTKITYVEELEKKYAYLFEDEPPVPKNFNNSFYY